MFLSIRQPSMRETAIHTDVIDRKTGERIPRVIWANDTTGRYRQYLIDDTGKILHDGKRALSKIFSGDIELRTRDKETN